MIAVIRKCTRGSKNIQKRYQNQIWQGRVKDKIKEDFRMEVTPEVGSMSVN